MKLLAKLGGLAWVVVGSGLTLAVIVLVVGLLAKLGGPSVSTTGAGLSLTVVVPVGLLSELGGLASTVGAGLTLTTSDTCPCSEILDKYSLITCCAFSTVWCPSDSKFSCSFRIASLASAWLDLI